MRTKRPRLTIRRMMLAIAVFTIALHVGLVYRRSPDHFRQARFWAHKRQVALVRARNVESGAARLNDASVAGKRNELETARRFAEYSSRMRSKYERAVFLPWLPVEADPDPP
ncbi:MAG: hypothetical protein ACLQIB_38225 [Isosphaeraceae bacterium]